jgi:hypothetical protein
MASTPVPTVRRQRSFAGAIVLIILGVIFLLGNVGVLTWPKILYGFAKYWPVLLIIWGIVKLLEYFHAQRSGYAAPGIGAGGVVLMVFVVFFGLIASTAARHAPHIQVDGEPFSFMGTAYSFQEELEQPSVPGNNIEVNGVRGNVTVIPWDEPRVKVVADKRVRAGSEEEARRAHERAKISISQVGDTIAINAPSAPTGGSEPFEWKPSVQANLQIYAPRKADVKIQSRRGEVAVEGREGMVEIEAAHGDVTVRDVKGNAKVRAEDGDFDVRVENITGDVTVEGRVDDSTVSSVSGKVNLLGEFFGEMRVSKAGKGLRFSSRRTDMETGTIQGELIMDSGELRATQLAGLKILARASKDVRLENVSGNVEVATRNGSVEVYAEQLPLGNISITNDKGPIQLYLPSGAAVRIEAQTRHGEIESDFDELKVDSQGRETKLSGAIGPPGSKAARVQLTTEHADNEIRKRG